MISCRVCHCTHDLAAFTVPQEPSMWLLCVECQGKALAHALKIMPLAAVEHLETAMNIEKATRATA